MVPIVVAMVGAVRPIVAVIRTINTVAGVVAGIGVVWTIAITIVGWCVAVSIAGISIIRTASIVAVRGGCDGAPNDGAGGKGADAPTPRSIRNALDRMRLRQANRLVADLDRVLAADDIMSLEASDVLASRVFLKDH